MADIENELDKLDSDGDFEIGETSKRDPSINTLKKIKAGAKDNIKNINIKDQVLKSVASAIPDVMGRETGKQLKQTIGDAKRSLGPLKKEIRESTSDLLEFAEANVKTGSFLDKALKKTKKFLGEDISADSSNRDEETISRAIKQSIGSENKVSLANLELNKRLASVTVKQNNTGLVVASKQLELIEYSTALHERYYKKSIELKYRQLFELKISNKEQRDGTEQLLTMLSAIEKNTALPDAVKIKSVEVVKLQSQQRLAGKLYDYVGVNKITDNVLSRGLKRKFTDIKNNTLDTLSAGGSMVGMMGMVDEDMLEMMSPEERSAYSKTAMVSGMATGSIIDTIRDKTIGKLMGKFGQTKVGAKIRNTSDKLITDPNRMFSNLEDETDSKILGKVFGFLKDVTTDDGLSGSVSITTKSDDLSDIANFDVRTYNSLNTSIPSLLSKILREVTVISTGDKNTEELAYDSNKGTFVKSSNASKLLKSDMSRLHGANKGKSVLLQVKKLEKLSGIELTERERSVMARSLLEYDNSINADYLQDEIDSGLFSNLSPSMRMKLSSVIFNAADTKVMGKDGNVTNDYAKRTRANATMGVIHGHNVNMVARIENMVKDGMGDQLLKDGFVTYDKSTETYRVVDSKIRQVNANILLSKVAKSKPKESTSAPVKVDMELLKAKVAAQFTVLPKDALMENISKMKGMSSEDKKEISAFINKNYKRSNDIFDGISKTVRDKSNPKADTVFDKKINGKNFFDKIALAVNKGDNKKKTKYDSDGDGDRDGSWKDIFSMKKLNKDGKTSNTMEDMQRGIKSKSGVLGTLMPLFGLVTNAISLAMAPFSALKDMAISLTSLPRMLGSLKDITQLLFGGFRRLIGSVITSGLNTVSALISTAGGGVMSKAKNLFSKFTKKGIFKAILATGAGALAYKSMTTNTNKDGGMLDAFSDIKLPGVVTPEEESVVTTKANKNDDESNLATYGLTGAALATALAAKKVHDMKNKKDMEKAQNSVKQSANKAKDSIKNNKVLGTVFKKAIPGVNIAFGLNTVGEDISKGDYGKAALHTLSTALSVIPLLGVPLSLAADYMIDRETPEETELQKVNREAVREQTRGAGRRGYKSQTSTQAIRDAVREQTRNYGRRGHNPTANTPAMNTNPRAKRDSFDHLHAGDRYLLEAISEHESQRGAGGYDMVHSSYQGKMSKPLTHMTLLEVSALQGLMESSGAKSSAVGKYQFIKITFDEVRKKMGLKLDTKFNDVTQDSMVLSRLVYMRQYDDWKAGTISDEQFLDNLSLEFASIPSSRDNSRYAGTNGNKILTSANKMLAVLDEVRRLLKLPKNTANAEVVSTSNIDTAVESKDNTVVAGIKASIKAFVKFFGGDSVNYVKGYDGDSSTNKPLPTPTTKLDNNYVPSVEGSNFKFCGLPIIRKPAIKRAIDKAGNRKFTNGKPKHLIIHNTAGASLTFSRMKSDGYGTQWWIDRDGKIYLVGDIDQIVYHVGPRKENYKHVTSANSMGIEMVCPYNKSKRAWEPYTAMQAKSLQALAACIRQTFDITPDRVFYHEQVSPKTLGEGEEGARIAKTLQLPDPDTSDTNIASSQTGNIETSYGTPVILPTTIKSGVDGYSDSLAMQPIDTPSKLATPHSPIINTGVKPSGDMYINKTLEDIGTQSLTHLSSIDNTLIKILEANQEMLKAQGVKAPAKDTVEKRTALADTPNIDLSS